MSAVITLANQKGGTGKTTTAVNLGTYLSAYGQKTLLIDFDPQANATSTFFDSESINTNIYHAIVGKVSPEDIVKVTKPFSMDLLPATPELAGANVELVNEEDREFKLHRALSGVRNEYDVILVDCPPSLGLLTLNGIVAADYVMIPVQSEYYALEGLGQLLNTVNLIRDNLGRDVELLGAVCTMYDKRNRLSRTVLKDIRRNFPGHVFDSVVPRNIDLAEAPGFSKTIYSHSPDSHGALAYRNLAREVIKLIQ